MITETFRRNCYKRSGVLFGLLSMATIREVFSANLRYWLEAGGRKQSWLAEQLGVANSAITRWKEGETLPAKAEHFDKLAELIGVPLPLLFIEGGLRSPGEAARSLAEQVSKS